MLLLFNSIQFYLYSTFHYTHCFKAALEKMHESTLWWLIFVVIFVKLCSQHHDPYLVVITWHGKFCDH